MMKDNGKPRIVPHPSLICDRTGKRSFPSSDGPGVGQGVVLAAVVVTYKTGQQLGVVMPLAAVFHTIQSFDALVNATSINKQHQTSLRIVDDVGQILFSAKLSELASVSIGERFKGRSSGQESKADSGGDNVV
jgi:hypothetical protein